jgi:hypothetical protein
MNNKNLLNGEINELRDKLDNEHIIFKSNLLNNNRYEIYSVKNGDKIIKIGDVDEPGIISDFFINDKHIYIRYANILKNNNGIKIKKNVIKL